jgi:xylulokinase
MAAESAGLDGTEAWNPVSHVVAPRAYPAYDEGFELYRQLYERTAPVAHALARLQHARHPGQQ